MKKSLLIVLIVLALVAVLFSCNKSKGNNDETSAPDTTTAAESTTAEVTAKSETTTPATETTDTDETTAAEITTVAETTAEETTVAETVPEDGIYENSYKTSKFVWLSFDECEAWNGNTELAKFFAPGVVSELKEITDVDGHATDIRFWGWFALVGADAPAGIGYAIDGGTPVFDEEFFFEAQPEVFDAASAFGGEYATRFNIYADITGLDSGEHIIKFFYKLADGKCYKLSEVKINLGYKTPKAGTTTEKFVTDLASQEKTKGKITSADIGQFFTYEMPLGTDSAWIEDGFYALGGISDFYKKMDGEYQYAVNIVGVDGTDADVGFFVRGYGKLHSVEVPAAADGLYPINNYYETDGNGGAGGTGIYFRVINNEGNLTLVVNVKAFDSTVKTRVANKQFNFSVDSTLITVIDKDNVVYIYSGSNLVTYIVLSGWTKYEDVTTPDADIWFSESAEVYAADNTLIEKIDNTLVVDNAASEIGCVARGKTAKTDYISVKAPDSYTDGDAAMRHVSQDRIGGSAEGTTITVDAFGWISCTNTVKAFGYILDNNLPVFDAAYNRSVDTEQPVLDAIAATGGTTGLRFNIGGAIENAFYGIHTVKYAVLFEDGTVSVMAEKKIYVLRNIIEKDDENSQYSSSAITSSAIGDTALTIESDGVTISKEKLSDTLYVNGSVITTAALKANGFGYVIDGSKDRVFKAGFASESEGAFTFAIDVNGLAIATHSIQLCYTLEDETIVCFYTLSVNVTAPIEAPKYIISQASQMGTPLNAVATDKDGYFTLESTVSNDPQFATYVDPGMSNCGWVLVKYRTDAAADHGQFFIGSGAGPSGAGDLIDFIYNNDGDWHYLYIDLAQASAIVNGAVSYFRYDFFYVEGSIDIAYIAFCGAYQDAVAYVTGA